MFTDIGRVKYETVMTFASQILAFGSLTRPISDSPTEQQMFLHNCGQPVFSGWEPSLPSCLQNKCQVSKPQVHVDTRVAFIK